MFNTIFEGENFSYAFNARTNEYMLFSNDYKISYPLKGDDANLFAEHLKIIKNQRDETLNARIERTIKIYLYFITPSPDNKPKCMPVFIE